MRDTPPCPDASPPFQTSTRGTKQPWCFAGCAVPVTPLFACAAVCGFEADARTGVRLGAARCRSRDESVGACELLFVVTADCWAWLWVLLPRVGLLGFRPSVVSTAL